MNRPKELGKLITLSIALRDCLSCFDDVLNANVTEERVETWRKVLSDCGVFDYPQGVKRTHKARP